MAALAKQAGIPARALEFAILSAARSGEVFGARWSEIDFIKKVWTVPASRMKGGAEHVVPLSPAALDLLTTCRVRPAATDSCSSAHELASGWRTTP